jgi:hypothetical protein
MTSPDPSVDLAAHHDQVSLWQAQGILMEVLGCNAREAADLIHKRNVADAIASTGPFLAS